MTEKQIQSEAKKLLSKDGWEFWFPPPQWGVRDIFGVFDFIAVKDKRLLLCQITTISNLSHRRKKIKRWLDEKNIFPYYFEAVVWAWRPSKDNSGGGFFVEENIIRS